jgi:hypothetical protein
VGVSVWCEWLVISGESVFKNEPVDLAQIPQELKLLNFPALFGTTEVVPFHDANYETRSNHSHHTNTHTQ